jgi:hypothetical protein
MPTQEPTKANEVQKEADATTKPMEVEKSAEEIKKEQIKAKVEKQIKFFQQGKNKNGEKITGKDFSAIRDKVKAERKTVKPQEEAFRAELEDLSSFDKARLVAASIADTHFRHLVKSNNKPLIHETVISELHNKLGTIQRDQDGVTLSEAADKNLKAGIIGRLSAQEAKVVRALDAYFYLNGLSAEESKIQHSGLKESNLVEVINMQIKLANLSDVEKEFLEITTPKSEDFILSITNQEKSENPAIDTKCEEVRKSFAELQKFQQSMQANAKLVEAKMLEALSKAKPDEQKAINNPETKIKRTTATQFKRLELHRLEAGKSEEIAKIKQIKDPKARLTARKNLHSDLVKQVNKKVAALPLEMVNTDAKERSQAENFLAFKQGYKPKAKGWLSSMASYVPALRSDSLSLERAERLKPGIKSFEFKHLKKLAEDSFARSASQLEADSVNVDKSEVLSVEEQARFRTSVHNRLALNLSEVKPEDRKNSTLKQAEAVPVALKAMHEKLPELQKAITDIEGKIREVYEVADKSAGRKDRVEDLKALRVELTKAKQAYTDHQASITKLESKSVGKSVKSADRLTEKTLVDAFASLMISGGKPNHPNDKKTDEDAKAATQRLDGVKEEAKVLHENLTSPKDLEKLKSFSTQFLNARAKGALKYSESLNKATLTPSKP